MHPTKSGAMVSKFSVDLQKRFGEAVAPSDTKKFNKFNSSLITRCGPQTVTREFLCCCDWDGAVQAARTGGVCETREGAIGRNRNTGEPVASNNTNTETMSVTPVAAAMGCHASVSRKGKQRQGW